jgi:hypothetical protein
MGCRNVEFTSYRRVAADPLYCSWNLNAGQCRGFAACSGYSHDLLPDASSSPKFSSELSLALLFRSGANYIHVKDNCRKSLLR